MRRGTLLSGGIALLVIAGYLAYSQVYVPSKSATPTPEPRSDSKTVIWASGEVLPAQWAQLSFTIDGRVEEILVAEGDSVEHGAPLIRLVTQDLDERIRAAEAALQAAEAELVRAKVGPRAEEVASAGASVREAEAALTSSQAALRRAKADYEHVLAGARAEEVTASLATLKKVAAALQAAQAEYDKIKWSDAIGTSPQSLALEQATLDYEAAQAKYQELVKGATPELVAAAQADVEAATANVGQREATLARAQAQLALLKAGPRTEDVAVAEAGVASARAELDNALIAVEKATLHAPFSGTIGAVDVRRGEQVTTGVPVLVIGDLSHFRVETTDLRETDVSRVGIGQPVEITFDALPDVVLTGRVSQIARKSSSEKGSVNYRTIIEFDQPDPRLMWGMTAYVNITVG